MEKTATRYDKILTKMAHNIFGDIVKAAYVTTWDIDSKLEEVVERLDKCEFKCVGSNKIDYGAETIWIEFTNGKCVEFSNSEWAFIRSSDKSNSYQA